MVKEEKMRINFRDFFTYAIKGVQSDPIQPGICSSSCHDQSNCCASVVAIENKSNFIANDNLCMLKSVVNSWGDLTIENVKYTMKCGDQQKAVSSANFIKQSIGIYLSATALFFTCIY